MSKKKAKKKEEPVCKTCEETLKKVEVWVCPECWKVYEVAKKAPGED